MCDWWVDANNAQTKTVFSSSWQVSMYTVVSLTDDLAGEPDTVDFYIAFICLKLLLWILASWWLMSWILFTPNVNLRYALWPAMVRNNMIYVWYASGRQCFCTVLPFMLTVPVCVKSTQALFLLSRFFLLSLRAPVRGTLPCTAPCLPRRISRTRMTIVLNLDRHHRHLGTLYPGTYPDMRGPRGKYRVDPCWTQQREQCSGSQVRNSLVRCPDSHHIIM